MFLHIMSASFISWLWVFIIYKYYKFTSIHNFLCIRKLWWLCRNTYIHPRLFLLHRICVLGWSSTCYTSELPCWLLLGLLNREIKCSNYIPQRFYQLPLPPLMRNYADHPTHSTTSNAILKIQIEKEKSHLIVWWSAYAAKSSGYS